MGATTSIPDMGVASVEVEGSGNPAEGLGPARRHPRYADELRCEYFKDATTLYECFQRGLQVSADAPCMGVRPVVGTEKNERGQDQPKYGDYTWTNYRDCAARRDRLGSGLVNRNLFSTIEDMGKTINMLGIYSRNTPMWVLLEQACNAYGGCVVPLYDSLGVDAVSYVLQLTEMRCVACEPAKLDTLLTVKEQQADKAATLETIILLEGSVSAEQEAKRERLGLTIITFDQLEAAGRENMQPHRPPKPDDVATVCFTSGTTGNPKGAVLTHQNFVSVASAPFFHGAIITNEDVYLSYLPLAHIMERAVEAAMWVAGARVGFYNGNTLRIVEDIKAIRPTFFASVPRLFNKIHDKLMAGVEKAGGTKKALFMKALEAKKYWLKRNYLTHGFWDRLVFSGVKEKVGLDRVRMMLTGSAPIAPHVMEFLRCVFGCVVIEGYGQTETAACTTLSFPSDQTSLGHVGGPAAMNEVRLVAVPELQYSVTDTVHRNDGDEESPGVPCHGRGEICFRGRNIFVGYLRNPEKTAESFMEGGWLRSGDLGIFDSQGRLRIVGRKSVNFKLSQGEFIRPEHIENIYTQSPLVQQAFAYGDSYQSCLVGVIVPEPEVALAWARENNKPTDLQALCNDDDFKKHILATVRATGKGAGLSGFEIIRAVHAEPNPFSVENELLTPTFKLKRRPAAQYYRAQIDAMYQQVGGVAGVTGLRQGAAAGAGGPAAGGN